MKTKKMKKVKIEEKNRKEEKGKEKNGKQEIRKERRKRNIREDKKRIENLISFVVTGIRHQLFATNVIWAKRYNRDQY